MKPTDFAQHVTRFLGEYLPAQRNVSPNTIASYRDAFALLLRYCQKHHHLSPERLPLDRINASLISGFLRHLETERHCVPRTRNQRLSALHAFFRYLQSEAPERLMQCQQILALPSQRHARRPVPYLSAEDTAALLVQPDRGTGKGRRHTALLSALYDTGARAQELVDLRVGDVRLETPAQIRLTGKGRKTRIVPLMSNTVTTLKEYMREHGLLGADQTERPLFTNRYGNALTRSGVSYLTRKYSQGARRQRSSVPSKVSPHTLRHTKAMHLLQAGNPMPVIQAILGHADIKTCAIYASADLEMKRKALEKAATKSAPQPLPSWQSNKGLMDWLRSL